MRYQHTSGRVVEAFEGSRLHRLLEADENWTPVEAASEKTEADTERPKQQRRQRRQSKSE